MQKIHSTSNSIIGLLDNIDISQIKPFKYSYRRNVSEDLTELCYSIKEKGLLHPIIVRMIEGGEGEEGGGYEIVAGTRRYNACKMLGWRKIFCQVVELEDKDAFEDYVTNYGWGGISELATRLGKSVSYVDKRIRLLDLPADVVESLSTGSLSVSIGDELLPLKEKEQQSKLAELIKKRKLSSRQVRELKNE